MGGVDVGGVDVAVADAGTLVLGGVGAVVDVSFVSMIVLVSMSSFEAALRTSTSCASGSVNRVWPSEVTAMSTRTSPLSISTASTTAPPSSRNSMFATSSVMVTDAPRSSGTSTRMRSFSVAIDTSAAATESTATATRSLDATSPTSAPVVTWTETVPTSVMAVRRLSPSRTNVTCCSGTLTRIVSAPNMPARITATTPFSPGTAVSPVTLVAPPVPPMLSAQLRLTLVTARSIPRPVPEPLKGSGKGASRTDSGEMSIRLPVPVQAAGSVRWSGPK